MDQQDVLALLPKKSRKSWSITGFWFLLASVGFSSVVNNGVFSGNYVQNSWIFLVLVVLVSYALIISMMKAIGLDPNMGEMIFVPTVIITVVYLALQLMGVPTMIQEIRDEVNQEVSVSQTTISLPTNGTDATIYGSANTTDVITEVNNTWFYNILSIIGFAFLFVVIALGLYWIYKQEGDKMPSLKLSNIIQYSKKPEAIEIMKLYIHASFMLEKMHGYAPKWFSPSKFAHKIDNDQGPPISDYFDRLTVLYEIARFSDEQVTQEMLYETQEIYNQIEMWHQRLQDNLQKEGSS